MNPITRAFWSAATVVIIPETIRDRFRRDRHLEDTIRRALAAEAELAARVAWHEQAGYGPGCFTPGAYGKVIAALTARQEVLYSGDHGHCPDCVVGWDPQADRCGLIIGCPAYPACSQPARTEHVQ